MICSKYFQYIKLKCFFYFSIFSSNYICKKEDMTTISKYQTNTNMKNWSMIDDGDDYGQFYDTENNENLLHENKKMKEYEYDDPYEEYMDRFEQHLNYEETQIANEYNGKTIYEKLINGKILFYEHPLLYIVQYILGYCN